MAEKQLETVLQQLRQVVGAPGAEELADQQLLQRFTQKQEEAAFSALVRRHGPMVYGVCRRVLRDAHQAEDAFQATFLVLARKAGSIRKQESVASWLHGVAYRIAGKARASAYRRSALERRAMAMRQPELEGPRERPELEEALDQELHKLPEKYRAPLVLCYLEGKSNDEAARQLGWTTGTVRGRLFRGRDLLRSRLARRGLGVASATALTAVMAESAQAAVPPALLEATVRAGVLFAKVKGGAVGAGISATAASMAETAMRGMFWEQFKAPVAAMACTGLAGLAAFVGLGAMASDRPFEVVFPNGTGGRAAEVDPLADQARELDVLNELVKPGTFVPGLLEALEQGTQGPIWVEACLTDEKGMPVAGQDVLFRWRTGDITLRTDVRGIVALELRRGGMEELRLVLPPKVGARLQAVAANGERFDFDALGQAKQPRPAALPDNLEAVRGRGIEVICSKGRTELAQRALNDLEAMRRLAESYAGIELLTPCRLVVLPPGQPAPEPAQGLQLFVPLADLESAYSGQKPHPAESGQWLILHRWGMASLAVDSATQPSGEVMATRSALAEVLSFEFCRLLAPTVAVRRLEALVPHIAALGQRDVRLVDLRVNGREAGGALMFLYWQQQLAETEPAAKREIFAQARENPQSLLQDRFMQVDVQAAAVQLNGLLNECKRAGIK